MLQLTRSHETLILRASEQASFARQVGIGQFYIANDSVMGGNRQLYSFMQRIVRSKEFSVFEISQQFCMIMSSSDQ